VDWRAVFPDIDSIAPNVMQTVAVGLSRRVAFEPLVESIETNVRSFVASVKLFSISKCCHGLFFPFDLCDEFAHEVAYHFSKGVQGGVSFFVLLLDRGDNNDQQKDDEGKQGVCHFALTITLLR
jgi:hypothetical protein